MKKKMCSFVFFVMIATAILGFACFANADYDIKVTEPEEKDGYGNDLVAGMVWWDDFRSPHGLIKPLNNTSTSVPQDHPVRAYVKTLLDNPPSYGESGWKVFPYHTSRQGTDCLISLVQIIAGDFDGNGIKDLAGIDASNNIFYTLDLANWKQIPGRLSQLAVGDLTGDGRDDLAGITADGQIFYTSNLRDWVFVLGTIQTINIGDISNDGIADIFGSINGVIYWTPNKGEQWFIIANPVK
jgi:hypothetical protein